MVCFAPVSIIYKPNYLKNNFLEIMYITEVFEASLLGITEV